MHDSFLQRSGLLLLVQCALMPLPVALASAGDAVDDALLTCVSEDGARRHCSAYTGAGVALQESVGTAECLLGRNWGYDASSVWVTEGCGAKFMLGNPAHEAGRVAAAPAPAAPAGTPADETPSEERKLGDYRAYARFGVQTAMTEGEAQVQDARSRLGLEFSTGKEIRLFAHGEWSVRLTGVESPFNSGETTSTGYIILDDSARRSPFGSRLGYVGVDFGDRGRLTLGKQWAVHYDVAAYTDRFNVFGADASATFNAGTDGGFLGTGRADSALIYRDTLFDRLELGLQVQMRGVSDGEFLDGYGTSVQLELLEGLKLGATYTYTLFDDRLKSRVVGLNGNGEFGAVGARYDTEKLNLAAVFAFQRNGDLFRIPILEGGETLQVPVVFDAEGTELFGRYQLTERLGLLGGYLNYSPDLDASNRPFIDERAGLEYYVLGSDFRWRPNALAFAEIRLADGIDEFGQPGEDVFVLGLQYGFARAGAFSYP